MALTHPPTTYYRTRHPAGGGEPGAAPAPLSRVYRSRDLAADASAAANYDVIVDGAEVRSDGGGCFRDVGRDLDAGIFAAVAQWSVEGRHA